ncbi:MAG: hypothetical protein IJ728_11495 [Selenomonadaceae bacterium]|nr:hypothetical protein [Selenomonadaceae bacterium]
MTDDQKKKIITLAKLDRYNKNVIETMSEVTVSLLNNFNVSAAATLILPTSDTGVIHSLWLDDSE